MKRFTPDFTVKLITLNSRARRGHLTTDQIKTTETEQLLAAVPANNLIVALDEHGKIFTTQDLANKLSSMQREHRDLAILIGGTDGFDLKLLRPSVLCWSLSLLTFPHQLARLIIIEQLYRALTILHHHPYHRT